MIYTLTYKCKVFFAGAASSQSLFSWRSIMTLRHVRSTSSRKLTPRRGSDCPTASQSQPNPLEPFEPEWLAGLTDAGRWVFPTATQWWLLAGFNWFLASGGGALEKADWVWWWLQRKIPTLVADAINTFNWRSCCVFPHKREAVRKNAGCWEIVSFIRIPIKAHRLFKCLCAGN